MDKIKTDVHVEELKPGSFYLFMVDGVSQEELNRIRNSTVQQIQNHPWPDGKKPRGLFVNRTINLKELSDADKQLIKKMAEIWAIE